MFASSGHTGVIQARHWKRDEDIQYTWATIMRTQCFRRALIFFPGDERMVLKPSPSFMPWGGRVTFSQWSGNAMPCPLSNGGDYFGSFKSGLAATCRSARSFYLKFSHFVSFLQGCGPRGDLCYSTLGFATHFCPVFLDRCLRFEYSTGSYTSLIWSGSRLLVGGCLISCPALQMLLYP